MKGSSRLEQLRRRAAAARSILDGETGAQVTRLEAGIGRRHQERKVILREMEHLRARISELERRARANDLEVAGLERALEMVLADALHRAGLQTEECWSPVPVIGFRLWHVAVGGLHGAKVRWSSRFLEASCLRLGFGPMIPHLEGECGHPPCGIYAAKRAHDLVTMATLLPPAPLALGMVALTGRVVEHERGYRAERAEALALALVDGSSMETVTTATEVDEVFGSTGEEIRSRCRPARQVWDRTRAFLEDEARRKAQWTSESS